MPSDEEFKFQKELTKKLDNISADFDQNIINEIVLWKVNRYANLKDELISELNSLNSKSTEIDIDKTKGQCNS